LKTISLHYIRFRCRIDGVVTDKAVSGPYQSKSEAEGDIQRVLNEAMKVDCWAVFYHFYVDAVDCRTTADQVFPNFGALSEEELGDL